jgi:hypothetical protein
VIVRGFSSGRLVCEWARVGREALVQDSQAASREELRLGGLTILSRPVAAHGERIGGGPIRHAWLTEPKHLAGPSAPSLAMPYPTFNFTSRISQRAKRSRCARPNYGYAPPALSGAVFLLKIGARVLLGIT